MTQHGTPRWSVSDGSVCDIFLRARDHAPDRDYLKWGTESLTYAQTSQAIAALVAKLGDRVKGRTVALLLPNSAAFQVAYFATLFAGAQPALLNFGHPDATVAKLLANLDVADILSGRDVEGFDATRFDDSDVLALSQTSDAPALETPSDLSLSAAILYSGGTTGLPKQVHYDHPTLVKKVERMEWAWPTRDGDVWLPVAPFTHVYGFLMGPLNPLFNAGTLVLPGQFHPDTVMDLLVSERVSIFGGGPTAIYQALMASAKFADADLSSLHTCPGGGSSFPLDVLRRWEAATGLPIREGYGMTEIAPIAINTQSDGFKMGTAGRPAPGTVIEIMDVAEGTKQLGAGETGEIRVKGPHMMREYAGNPEETAATLRDGFVYTGDIGHLDEDGFLLITDRKKDVLFVKGFNVFPREVEEVLLEHPAITGACVVGRADARAQERPVAFIMAPDGVDLEELETYCETNLTDYKLPADIQVIDALPLTPNGKVDRLSLRAQANEA